MGIYLEVSAHGCQSGRHRYISVSQFSETVVALTNGVKRLLIFCGSNPVQHDPRFNTGDVFWLGKRVIALQLDVVKMEELGEWTRTHMDYTN